MSRRSPDRRTLPAGPVFSVMLVGILVLSALIYYRAVKIQRFLEPALALSIPRSEFSHKIMDAMAAEFGSSTINGINFRTISIQIAGPLIFTREGRIHPIGHMVLKKVARAFRSVLQDDRTKPDIGFVLLVMQYPEGSSGSAAAALRETSQKQAWRALDVMYTEEPELGRDFGHFFSAVAAPGVFMPESRNDIEIRIVPSERMHIEFLQKLEKYTH